MIKSLSRAEDAFSLPEGSVALGIIQVSVSRENVIEAAQLLLDKNDAENLSSQADIIARAGKHGWGAGDTYQVINHGTLKEEKETEAILSLTEASDVLKLARGRLAINMGILIEASFDDAEALSAAELLIEKEDAADLVSQAGAIARAGKHGWGVGDSYQTL